MNILKIKNCLAVVVLLGATSGYSMESSSVPPSIVVEDMSSLHVPKLAHKTTPLLALGRPDLRDDCSRSHRRRGSVSSDSDSDDEGGSFVKIVNQNSKGRAIAAKSHTLDLLKMAAESSEGMAEAERLVRKSHLLIAKAVDCQAKSLEAFARGASIRLESDVVVDKTGRFFQESGSACSRAREERATADVLRSMAAASESRVGADLRMARADASLAAAEERTALELDRDAAVLMSAAHHSSDDEHHVVSSKKKKRHGKRR